MRSTGSVGVFICTLSALFTTEAGLLKQRRQISSSFRSSSVICLNGGTSVPSVYTGEHLICLCADGYDGKLCEIETSRCYEGVGLYYRGMVSQSESGRMCVE
ncbi:hypothetical protein LDENG_00003900 [Lucifuga dentata]|nr:hypothetical protein LDENG_00003900 [Lucifuga dentata]